MRATLRIILFGTLIWTTIFIGAMFIFKLHATDRIFFETLISVIFVFCVMFYSVLYFKKVKSGFLNEGVKIGLVWAIVNLTIDMPIFTLAMKQTLWSYFKDIGFMYLAIPFITIPIGYLLDKKIST